MQPWHSFITTCFVTYSSDGTDTNEDWVSFFVKFEMYADAYRWTNVQKRPIFTFEMSGTCRVLCKLLGKLNWGVTFDCIGFCIIGD
jgi:hypothetical protein